jgi:alpha-tubulin suppressor-like RCC1 family protein
MTLVVLKSGCLFNEPSVNYVGSSPDGGPSTDASDTMDVPQDATDTSSMDAVHDTGAMDADTMPSDGGDIGDTSRDGGDTGPDAGDGRDGGAEDGGTVDAGPPRWVDFDIGRNFSCAVHSTGRIECWGDSNYSDRGNKDKTFTDFTDVAVGDEHACALIAGSGEVICWGDQTVPGSLGPFDNINAGRDHTCGLRSDGKLRCWGNGFHNGGNDTFDANIPMNDTFRAFDAGGNLACGVHDTSDGEVECWYDGSSGDPTGVIDNTDAPYAAVTANEDAFCTLTQQLDFARCWGGNFDEDKNPSSVPFRSISMGIDHACGVRQQDGTITCWGSFNDQGSIPAGNNFVQVKAHKWHTCGLTDAGKLECWGDSPYADAPAP